MEHRLEFKLQSRVSRSPITNDLCHGFYLLDPLRKGIQQERQFLHENTLLRLLTVSVLSCYEALRHGTGDSQRLPVPSLVRASDGSCGHEDHKIKEQRKAWSALALQHLGIQAKSIASQPDPHVCRAGPEAQEEPTHMLLKGAGPSPAQTTD